jgi:hypothetical protein
VAAASCRQSTVPVNPRFHGCKSCGNLQFLQAAKALPAPKGVLQIVGNQ